MPPGHWRVQFYERDQKSNAVTGWLGDSPPTPSDGGGGWEVVALPKRSAVIVWRGRPLMTMVVPFVLDGFADDEAIIGDRQTLFNMWRPDNPEDEPPVIMVDAIGDAVPFQSLDWVMTGLDWGDAESDADMNRTQQRFTVTLTEYRPDVRIQTQAQISAAKKARNKAQGKSGSKSRGKKTYTVKSGDTLTTIAQRLKIKGGWRAIADIQKPPITDPRSLKVGRKLLLP